MGRNLDSLDLIAAARDLVNSNSRGRPREANLRRAVSTAYYALFHCLATCCADTIAGADRHHPAWRQTYRALQHGTARNHCQRTAEVAKFPVEIRKFAETFVDMQRERHKADYDPSARFSKMVVIQHINEAMEAIAGFGLAHRRDRRAFAIYVMLLVRND